MQMKRPRNGNGLGNDFQCAGLFGGLGAMPRVLLFGRPWYGDRPGDDGVARAWHSAFAAFRLRLGDVAAAAPPASWRTAPPADGGRRIRRARPAEVAKLEPEENGDGASDGSASDIVWRAATAEAHDECEHFARFVDRWLADRLPRAVAAGSAGDLAALQLVRLFRQEIHQTHLVLETLGPMASFASAVLHPMLVALAGRLLSWLCFLDDAIAAVDEANRSVHSVPAQRERRGGRAVVGGAETLAERAGARAAESGGSGVVSSDTMGFLTAAWTLSDGESRRLGQTRGRDFCSAVLCQLLPRILRHCAQLHRDRRGVASWPARPAGLWFPEQVVPEIPSRAVEDSSVSLLAQLLSVLDYHAEWSAAVLPYWSVFDELIQGGAPLLDAPARAADGTASAARRRRDSHRSLFDTYFWREVSAVVPRRLEAVWNLLMISVYAYETRAHLPHYLDQRLSAPIMTTDAAAAAPAPASRPNWTGVALILETFPNDGGAADETEPAAGVVPSFLLSCQNVLFLSTVWSGTFFPVLHRLFMTHFMSLRSTDAGSAIRSRFDSLARDATASVAATVASAASASSSAATSTAPAAALAAVDASSALSSPVLLFLPSYFGRFAPVDVAADSAAAAGTGAEVDGGALQVLIRSLAHCVDRLCLAHTQPMQAVELVGFRTYIGQLMDGPTINLGEFRTMLAVEMYFHFAAGSEVSMVSTLQRVKDLRDRTAATDRGSFLVRECGVLEALFVLLASLPQDDAGATALATAFCIEAGNVVRVFLERSDRARPSGGASGAALSDRVCELVVSRVFVLVRRLFESAAGADSLSSSAALAPFVNLFSTVYGSNAPRLALGLQPAGLAALRAMMTRSHFSSLRKLTCAIPPQSAAAEGVLQGVYHTVASYLAAARGHFGAQPSPLGRVAAGHLDACMTHAAGVLAIVCPILVAMRRLDWVSVVTHVIVDQASASSAHHRPALRGLRAKFFLFMLESFQGSAATRPIAWTDHGSSDFPVHTFPHLLLAQREAFYQCVLESLYEVSALGSAVALQLFQLCGAAQLPLLQHAYAAACGSASAASAPGSAAGHAARPSRTEALAYTLMDISTAYHLGRRASADSHQFLAQDTLFRLFLNVFPYLDEMRSASQFEMESHPEAHDECRRAIGEIAASAGLTCRHAAAVLLHNMQLHENPFASMMSLFFLNERSGLLAEAMTGHIPNLFAGLSCVPWLGDGFVARSIRELVSGCWAGSLPLTHSGIALERMINIVSGLLGSKRFNEQQMRRLTLFRSFFMWNIAFDLLVQAGHPDAVRMLTRLLKTLFTNLHFPSMRWDLGAVTAACVYLLRAPVSVVSSASLQQRLCALRFVQFALKRLLPNRSGLAADVSADHAEFLRQVRAAAPRFATIDYRLEFSRGGPGEVQTSTAVAAVVWLPILRALLHVLVTDIASFLAASAGEVGGSSRSAYLYDYGVQRGNALAMAEAARSLADFSAENMRRSLQCVHAMYNGLAYQLASSDLLSDLELGANLQPLQDNQPGRTVLDHEVDLLLQLVEAASSTDFVGPEERDALLRLNTRMLRLRDQYSVTASTGQVKAYDLLLSKWRRFTESFFGNGVGDGAGHSS